MKLLASDYDNTFYISDEDIVKNINKVKKFRKNNIFLIATGRSYEEFMEKDNIYHIPYDYLILNHGTTIIKEGKVIYSKYAGKAWRKVFLMKYKLYKSSSKLELW